MNLVTHGVSPRRLAAAAGLFAALSGASAMANPDDRFAVGPPPPPAPYVAVQYAPTPAPPTFGQSKANAYQNILVSRALRGEVTYGSDSAQTAEVLTGSPTPGSSPASEACFSGEAPRPLARDRILDATLMLMATYGASGSTGSGLAAYFGTGTVIRSDEGLNRVLTAAHVTAPEMVDPAGVPVTLRNVYAFDGEGRLVAELGLTYAHTGRIELGAITQELVQEDVAVLSPVRFPSEEMARSWEGRGVEVATRQSESVLFFYGEGGSSLISGGFSGAALYNPGGQVVGLITEMVALSDTSRPAPNTTMPEAVMSGDLSAMGMRDRQLLEAIAPAPSDGVYVDSVAAGPPISGPDLLTALGVNPERIMTVPALDDASLYSAGFPARECRETWVTHEPRPDVPFQERPHRHMAVEAPDPTILTDVPGRIRTMRADGSVSELETAWGFWFGTAGEGSDLTVTDPFAPNGPDVTPEAPR